KAQHDLGKEDRTKNLLGAFKLDKDLTGKSVLIIDDLVTTGNTSLEMIRVLERANVKDIKILALASEKRVL
ncbi:phosphoribosyltransferase family protein, partial [uncultured Anaerococcus sp.]|uniref:ComF family protein n=1 Tax=uncultured Anaerococcus sp. TaxID=293428 RepID=UPI002889B415